MRSSEDDQESKWVCQIIDTSPRNPVLIQPRGRGNKLGHPQDTSTRRGHLASGAFSSCPWRCHSLSWGLGQSVKDRTWEDRLSRLPGDPGFSWGSFNHTLFSLLLNMKWVIISVPPESSCSLSPRIVWERHGWLFLGTSKREKCF